MIWCTRDESNCRITYITFDCDDMSILTGSKDGSINTWSMADGSLIRKSQVNLYN